MLLNLMGSGSTCCHLDPSGPILREAYPDSANLIFLVLLPPVSLHQKNRST